MPAQGMRAAWRVAVAPASTCGGERNRAWRRSASDVSLMGGIGPRRPCRASAETRQRPVLSCWQKSGSSRTELSAPLSAAGAPLIGGSKLPFLALGLFSLAVLAPAPDRLGAASHPR
jgi:hypothetical protein